jgi:spore coat polysaccharide biosynthesis predicted glycosyltransferase SpsG
MVEKTKMMGCATSLKVDDKDIKKDDMYVKVDDEDAKKENKANMVNNGCIESNEWETYVPITTSYFCSFPHLLIVQHFL